MTSSADGVLGSTIYEPLTLILAAGEKRLISGDLRYLTILTATNSAAVAISFNGAFFGPLPTGLALSDFASDGFWIQNTDVSPNTITIAKGNATIRDNRLIIDATNTLTTTVTNTVAQNLTTVGGVAVVSAGLAGVLSVGGPVADSAALGALNPLYAGGRVQTNVDSTLVNGDMCSLRMASGGQLTNLPYASPENGWDSVAAVGGLLNTTSGLTVKAAAATGVRNYVTSIDLMAEALTNATEFVIRDGASGTVIWRIKIPTGGLPATTFHFPKPIRGSTATLLEIATLTASGTGAVYANLHGYIAI